MPSENYCLPNVIPARSSCIVLKMLCDLWHFILAPGAGPKNLTFVLMEDGRLRARSGAKKIESGAQEEGVVDFRFGLHFFSGQSCREYEVVQDAITCSITTEELRRRRMVGRKWWTFVSQCACNLLFCRVVKRTKSVRHAEKGVIYTTGICRES